MLRMSTITTKHGYKARRVTLDQEAVLDQIAAEARPFIIERVNILNDNFGGHAVVYLTENEDSTRRWPSHIVTRNGEVYPL